MISEYFKLASKNLRRRKLRSWLTMIGIFISIATIFILISLSLGLQDAVQEQFRQLGTDKFFIQAKGQLGQPGSGGAVALTTDDVDVISKVSGVNKATYYIIANSKIEFHGQTRFAIVGAIEPEGIEMFSESANLKADEGRILRKGDSNVIMIGSQYKYNNIFKRPLEVGDSLVLNGQSFKIAGILKTVGNPADDKNIFMSEDDFRTLYNVSKRVDVIVVQTDEGRQLSEVAEQVKKRLMRSRDVKEKTIDFTIQTPEELLKTFGVILNILTGFLLGVAGISLLVGAIGVANTMYTSVIERTRLLVTK